MTPILDLACSVTVLLLVAAGVLWIVGASATATKFLQAVLVLAIILPVALAIAAPVLVALGSWWGRHGGEVKVTSLATSALLLIGLHVFLVRRATQRRPEKLSLKKRVE
jgi:hypothetical protein